MTTKRTLIPLALSLTISSASASALNKFFESLGGDVNHSTPGAFHDQSAGYYTGGGYVMRQRNTVVKPVHISLPRIGLGCNNLDMYFGSVSFFKGKELIEVGRQILSDMPIYAFQLLLKTKAPQIENMLTNLQKKVQDMNSLMLNSCQASMQIVGGMWPKGTAASEKICMDSKNSGNFGWYAARQHCEEGGKVATQVDIAQTKYKDLLTGEYNLVWHVLKKMPEYQDNNELAYFVMSITGTLISKNEGGRYRVKTLEPKADQKEFIAAYLKGGTTSRLVCNETEKCLSPLIDTVVIQNTATSPNATMKAKVIDKINGLRQKYIEKGTPTEEEISFLNDSVNLPIYKYIQVSVAAGTSFLMDDAAEYIAASLLLTQFDRVMSEIIQAVDDLQKVQLEDAAIAHFKENLQQARLRVQALLIGANNGSLYYFNKAIQAVERSVKARNS